MRLMLHHIEGKGEEQNTDVKQPAVENRDNFPPKLIHVCLALFYTLAPSREVDT